MELKSIKSDLSKLLQLKVCASKIFLLIVSTRNIGSAVFVCKFKLHSLVDVRNVKGGKTIPTL